MHIKTLQCNVKKKIYVLYLNTFIDSIKFNIFSSPYFLSFFNVNLFPSLARRHPLEIGDVCSLLQEGNSACVN